MQDYDCQHLVAFPQWIRDLRIDRTNHTGLAMFALRAVEPDWLLILNTDGVCKDLGGCGEGSVGGHEARVESVGLVSHDVLDRNTRVVEC